MKPFMFYSPVRVFFGVGGVEKVLPQELSKVGPTVMLAYGGGSIKRTGLYDQLCTLLQQAGKRIIDFGGITSNPTYEKVLEGAQIVNQEQVDFILAVGGGSVVDGVKIIAAAAKAPKDLWEMEFEDHQFPTEGVPFGIVLTLSGTGAEMNALAGITNEAQKRKTAVVGRYGEFSILDPTYLLTVPEKQLAAGIFDNLSHCMETYFGRGNCVSDDMNEAVMENIVQNAMAWKQSPQDVNILGNLMWDSSIVQSSILGLGKDSDFQCHSIEHQLCAYTNCCHGMALAVIHPLYYKLVAKTAPEKFARFGQTVFGLDTSGSVEEQASQAIQALYEFIETLGLDHSFSQMGISVSQETLKPVAQTCGISNGALRTLTRDEVLQILTEGL